MNVIFASKEASEVKLLKIRLSKLSRPSQVDASSNAKEIPADLRYVIVKQIGVTPDGLLKLPENGSFLGDIIVVDAAITGDRTQEAVKDAASKAPGVPIILLTDPEDEVSIIDALSAGATDCIPKTNKYLHRLLPAVEREIRRRILAREKTDISSREERLRQIVERVPVGVSVIAPDGTFLAINQAGLKLMGAAQLNQIVGKNFLHFIAQEDREKILEFLTTVSNGTNASIMLDWTGLDGTRIVLKLIATPMLKQGISGAAVLTGIYSTEDFPRNEKSEEEAQESAVLKKTLQELDVRFKELQEEHTLQKSKWEAAAKQDETVLLELQQKARESEEQGAALQADLRESEGKRTELETALHEVEEKRRQQAEDFDAERSRWEQARQQWDQQSQEIDEQRAELENRLREIEEHRNKSTEDYSTERSHWERLEQELVQRAREAEEQRAALQADLQESEGKRTELETALHEVEGKRRQQAEDFDAERSRWEQAHQQWDQQSQEIDEQRAELENRLREVEEHRNKSTEDYSTERSQWEQIKQEQEQKAREAEEQRAALQADLQESQGKRTELENKLREVEEQRNRTTEDYSTERSQWERIGQELEQRAQEAEEQRAALQADLQESQGKRTELENRLREIEEHRNKSTEDYSTERSQWEQIKQELEQKVREAEEQRAALQADLQESEGKRTELETALHEVEGKQRQQAEDFDAERSRWEQARQQWDQQFQEIDEQRAEMKITLREAGEQLTAIERSLRESEEKRRQQAEDFDAERSRWEQTHQQGDSKYQETEEQLAGLQTALEESGQRQAALETALGEAEEKGKKAAAEFNAERSRWEQTKRELERRTRETEDQLSGLKATLQGSEEQQTALETALRESEEKQKQLAETYEVERSRWEQNRLEWEQRLRQSEEQYAARLQKTIQEAEDRYGPIFEESKSKESQLKELRQRVQQLTSDLQELQSEFSKGKLGHRRLLENTSVGILQTTLEGRVLDCNDTAARMFGYDGANEAMSQTEENKVFSIYSYQGVFKERLLQEGRLENIEWSSLNRNGRMIRFRENAVLVKNPKGEGVIVERVLTDRTQFYMLREENRRMRKIGSTADLVGAAVKNLNNLCESLAQCGKLLKEAPDDGNSVRQVAEKLLKDATWGSKHAHQFFEASMKADQNPAVINLNKILSDNDTLLHSLVGEDIDLQIRCSPDSSLVMADRQKMIQLISNFVVSSLKILPLGGAVTIETENVEIDASACGQSSEIPSGTYVQMTISIDGCEILPERRLTHNKSIVDRMGGWIETMNDPQSGNMYKIYFPRIEAFVGGTALSQDSPKADPTGV